jgi:hypothetical protein
MNYGEWKKHVFPIKKQGVAEGSFGSGFNGPFTAVVNTGERPKSRTKTKKFKREDDAILWSEDWLEAFQQYVYATIEVKDSNDNVVWQSDDEQGVAEAQLDDHEGMYSPQAIKMGNYFIKEFNLTDEMDKQLAIEIVDNCLESDLTDPAEIRKQVIKYLKQSGTIVQSRKIG